MKVVNLHFTWQGDALCGKDWADVHDISCPMAKAKHALSGAWDRENPKGKNTIRHWKADAFKVGLKGLRIGYARTLGTQAVTYQGAKWSNPHHLEDTKGDQYTLF